jgi:hypothetical protein
MSKVICPQSETFKQGCDDYCPHKEIHEEKDSCFEIQSTCRPCVTYGFVLNVNNENLSKITLL